MTTEEAKDAPPPADGKKKKKEKPPPPPTPPSVTTAYLAVKTAALGALGVLDTTATECHVSPFQQTFLKDRILTGKFTLTIKKTAATSAMLSDALVADTFWTVLNQTLQRLVKQDIPIQTYNMTRAQIIDTYGPGALDESQVPGKKSKVKDDDVLTLAVLGDQVVAGVAPGQPYATLQALTECTVDPAQCDWKRLGKKETKVTLKFEAKVDNADAPLAAILLAEGAPAREQLNGTPLTFTEGDAFRLAIDEQDAAAARAEAAEAAAVAEAAAAAKKAAEDEEMVVTAEKVSGKIDYNKLVEQFGSQVIQPSLMQRLEALTVGQGRVPHLHRFLRRNIFFSHRDLDSLLNNVEKGIPMYLYTGRGPSSSAMHLGHLIPFLFTQWLQKAFGCPLVIQMTDDEKFLFKGNYDEMEGDNLNHFARLTIENAKDIIACEFDYDKTFLFSDLDYVGTMYPNICRIWKAVTTNTVNGIFGFEGTSNIGKIAFPAIQAAPSFANSFPTVLQADRNTNQQCLIPCAIDQDPYFRMTRDIAHKLVHKKHPLAGKPSLIHSKFFPPLQGATGKMSSSEGNSAIFLTDTPEEIEQKIMTHAHSGGQDTLEDQKKFGADLEKDVAYQWLRFFLEDDEELEQIGKDYASGSGTYGLTTAVKRRLISVLQELVAAHQERRARITDEEVRKWMKERSIL